MKISHYIVTTLTGGIESVSRGLRRHQCFHKAGSSSVQQSPSVYSYRGGRKSGDGVEGNLGDAGSTSIRLETLLLLFFTVNYYCTPLILIDFMCGLNIAKNNVKQCFQLT